MAIGLNGLMAVLWIQNYCFSYLDSDPASALISDPYLLFMKNIFELQVKLAKS
jgi:hypothetical protein